MGDWQLLWDGLIILGAIGVISVLFFDKINKITDKVEYYSTGLVTEHHEVIPFD
ncbi:MAG: hypothetical protein K9L17_01285 [Clostridiales bacterium]|nr:hypothetical protein [Clostridiales bacterium]MCF8021324.1 hypothetical protein [Clostridiales bacterium]